LMMRSIRLDKSANTCHPLHGRHVFAHLFHKAEPFA
jgi:hypothetical protein